MKARTKESIITRNENLIAENRSLRGGIQQLRINTYGLRQINILMGNLDTAKQFDGVIRLIEMVEKIGK